MSYFYSHLIKHDNLIIALGELNLSESQMRHLTSLADSTVHQTILDLILSQLSHADKIVFVRMLNDNPRDYRLLEFLQDKIDKIEDQIKQTARKVHEELHEDIKQSQRLNPAKK